MIDPNLPLELDDGTPVQLHKYQQELKRVWIINPVGSSVSRHRSSRSEIYWYCAKTGVFGGGTKENYKLLRNVDEKDLYERDLE